MFSRRVIANNICFRNPQALNKKEGGKGSLGSPDGMGGDSDGELDAVTTTTTTTTAAAAAATATTLTPRTEAKYNRIDEEFQLMMHRNQLNGGGNAAVRAVSYLQSLWLFPLSY